MDAEAVRLRNLLGFVERGPLMDAKDESQTSDLGTDSHTHSLRHWNMFGCMLTS